MTMRDDGRSDDDDQMMRRGVGEGVGGQVTEAWAVGGYYLRLHRFGAVKRVVQVVLHSKLHLGSENSFFYSGV
jgi:hypothetical protein